MTPKSSDRVTTQTSISYGSALSNYSDAYAAWDNAEEKECSACYGTGLDRDEIEDCPVCWGEGYIAQVDPSLPRMVP